MNRKRARATGTVVVVDGISGETDLGGEVVLEIRRPSMVLLLYA
jgi:hypothetical protein